MKPAVHITVSAAAAVPLYYITGSKTVAATSFFWGFLIDTDHVIDYLREYGLRFDLKGFFHSFYETRFRKLVLLFHAWEWVALLAVLIWCGNRSSVILGLLVGTVHHLLLDQFGNGPTNLGYSIIYRACRRFSTMEIIRKSVVDKKRGLSS